MTRRVRLIAIAGVIALLVGGGVFVALRLMSGADAIPQVDLFGEDTPPATTAGASPTPSPTPPPGGDIKGPLTILILGVDTRESHPSWVPNADAIMIMHINKDLTKAYLTSLPRDLVTNIPGHGRTKINAAMAFGSRVSSGRPDYAKGFQLMARTVSNYTGIPRFNAGAILTFNGLWNLVDALGGIDVYVDQRTVSIHRRPDGRPRTVCGGCSHGYSGPQMVYNVGRMHMRGWMALDYSRQRYVGGADYTRQRHQRQVVRAIIAKAFSRQMAMNPLAVQRVIKALGRTLTFDGRGRTPMEYAYALRNIQASKMVLVGLPGSSAYSGGSYIGENLNGIQSSYFAALRADRLDSFLAAHPTLVNKR